MPDSTLGNLPDATAATGGLFYGTQSGNDCKFTSSAAGAALLEAADVAAQQTALQVLPLTGGTLTGQLNVGDQLFVFSGSNSTQLDPFSVNFNASGYGVAITAPPGATSCTHTLPSTGGQLLNTASSLSTNYLTGIVSPTNLGSGTASSSTYLRGDSTFAALDSCKPKRKVLLSCCKCKVPFQRLGQ